MPPKGWKKPESTAIAKPDENKAKTEEQEVKAWSERISSTVQWQEQIAQKNGWKRYIKEFANNWDELKRQIDIPMQPVNYIYSYVKTEIARLYFRDPWITVNAKRMEDIASAKIAEQLINYTWSEIDLKRQIKLALMDCILVGHGWIKLGYTAKFGTVESKSKDENGKLRVDVNPNVQSENVFAVHYPWDHVIFDPSCTWPATNTARWMAFKWIKPLKAIQESEIYENVDDLKATEKPYKNDNGPANQVQSVVGWEIWDRDTMKVTTIVPGYDKKIREISWPDFIPSGFPAVMFSFNPIPGEPYPLSDIAPQEGQVHEMIKMSAIMHNHLKRWNRQIFMRPQLMTEESKSNFKNAIDGAIIECNGKFNEDFFIPPYAPVQQDVYGIWNLTNDVWRNTIGQSDQERGANVKSTTRTLGELRLSMQGARSRADEKVDCLEDSISEVARKLLTIMQMKYDLPKIVRIVGNQSVTKAMLDSRPSARGPMKDRSSTGVMSDGGIFSFTATKDDIKGEMDVDTLAGSTIPLNKENQLKILEQMLPNVLQIYGPKAGRELFREIMRLVNIQSLERISDIAEQEAEEAAKNPPPDPEMQKAQMDMQAKMQDAKMKAQLEQQKMQTEQQKADLQMQGLEAKVKADVIKAELEIEKAKEQRSNQVLQSMLQRVRQPSVNGNGNV